MAQYQQDDEVGMGYGSLAPGHAVAPVLTPANDFGFQVPPAPAPPVFVNALMNGEPSHLHPLEHIGRLIADHTNLLRQRLFAAHLQGGLPPELVSSPGQPNINPLDLVRQTKATNYSHLAALKAKFDRNAGAS